MLVPDLLATLGVPGTIVSVVVVVFAMYHFRSAFQVLSHVATWTYAMAVAFALVAIASTGIIPGVNLNPVVQLGRLGGRRQYDADRPRDGCGSVRTDRASATDGR